MPEINASSPEELTQNIHDCLTHTFSLVVAAEHPQPSTHST